MLAIFFSASEYAYNMLRFFRNFSLNMLIVVILIKKSAEKMKQSTWNKLIKQKRSREKYKKRLWGERRNKTKSRSIKVDKWEMKNIP